MKILLIEDDSRVASFIRRGLKEENYAVDLAKDGEEGLFMAHTGEYDLIILDVMLPKKTGYEVLSSLREEKNSVPVLMLTAKGGLEDKVKGLNAGADDYLAKPFGFEELLARARALLRRRGDMIPTVLQIGDLQMDTMRHAVTRQGKTLELTTREYALLEYFLRHKDQVVTRTMLSENVWEHDFDTMSNVIDVHVARLRRKVNDGFDKGYIHTVRGRGYIMQEKNPEEH